MENKKPQNNNIQLKQIQELLNQQTLVVLNAVDEKLAKTKLRINQKIDKLTTTLDNFLKRLMDRKTEFEIMKAQISQMRKIIREKLNVEI
jgi:hypothetical protein